MSTHLIALDAVKGTERIRDNPERWDVLAARVVSRAPGAEKSEACAYGGAATKSCVSQQPMFRSMNSIAGVAQ